MAFWKTGHSNTHFGEMLFNIGDKICGIGKTIFRLYIIFLALRWITTEGKDVLNTGFLIFVENGMYFSTTAPYTGKVRNNGNVCLFPDS